MAASTVRSVTALQEQTNIGADVKRPSWVLAGTVQGPRGAAANEPPAWGSRGSSHGRGGISCGRSVPERPGRGWASPLRPVRNLGWRRAVDGYERHGTPLWTGSISFGLVNVPVKAYTAVRDHDVHFNQLEKKTGARIRNKKVSDKTGKEVDADDIEMGFEIRKGRYVTFDKGELEELKPESTRAIDVTDFVDLEAVDPIYYERTYWLGRRRCRQEGVRAPARRHGSEAKVAIGTVVMRNKQYLAAIRPLDGALAMSTMRFADEVVPLRGGRRTEPGHQAGCQGPEAGHADRRLARR